MEAISHLYFCLIPVMISDQLSQADSEMRAPRSPPRPVGPGGGRGRAAIHQAELQLNTHVRACVINKLEIFASARGESVLSSNSNFNVHPENVPIPKGGKNIYTSSED